MAHIAKQQEVDTLIELLDKTPHFALIKYEATTHKALEELRAELRKSGASLRVIKNTLFEKALSRKATGDQVYRDFVTQVFPLKEQTALISCGEDYAGALASFFKFTKNQPSLSFKFGVVDGTVYMSSDLEKIAKLPSKEELMAKLIGGMKSPSYKLTYAMKFNITKLTLVLKERAKQS